MSIGELGLGRYPPLLVLNENASVLEVLAGMAEKRVRHCPLVSDEGALVGMVSARDLVDFLSGQRYRSIVQNRFKGDIYEALTKVRASELSRYPAWVTDDTPLTDVLARFIELGVGALVIVDRSKRVKGLLSERHVMSLFANATTYVQVREIMSRELVTAHPHEPISKALELMSRHRVRRIPLQSGGKLSGIVTVKDVLGFLGSESSLERLSAGEGESLLSTPLQSIASYPVLTVDAGEDVGKAVSIMKNHGVGCLVAVDKTGAPVGIVTERDVVTRLPRVRGVELFMDLVKAAVFASRVSF